MILTRLTVVALLGGALGLPASAQDRADPIEQGPKNVPSFEPAWPNQTRAPAVDSGISLEVETVADGLVHPWGIEVLPDGGYLVTEREGRLRVVRDGAALPPVEGVPEVFNVEQGGLLDVALAPDFEQSRRIYLTYSKPMGDGTSATAAATGVLAEDLGTLTEVEDIFVQEPPSVHAKHYGSRIVVDGDVIYVTTGEHSSFETRVFAQDLDKTYGKVVRLTPQGEAAPGNPFADRDGAVETIYTLGHRNVQGAAIRPETGELWALEHGPKGGDELNRITAGANYGWPEVSYGVRYSGEPIGSGDPRAEGFEEPRYYWDPVIAPGNLAFYDGALFPGWQGNVIAASLAPGGINRLVLKGDEVVGEEKFAEDQGRVRDVAIDRDGAILLLTDKSNGAILRLTPRDGA